MVACPYGARSFNFKTQEDEEYQRPDLPPDLDLSYGGHIGPWPYPHRTRGVVEKCTYCFHRIDQALENGWEIGSRVDGEDGVLPACVEACPTEARYFGDLDDPESMVSKLLASGTCIKLREEMATDPKTRYLPR
jgi:molybdopterin-containing oxidoreductase family iron-sulfur binding subunit